MTKDNSGETIVIFGGLGFIGNSLTARLVSNGYNVLSIGKDSIRFNCEEPFLRQETGNVTIEWLRSAGLPVDFGSVCAFVLLASKISVEESIRNPDLYISYNMSATRDSLEVAREINGRAPVIFLSTDRVFGDRRGVVTEFSRRSPIDAYGLSKALSEDLVWFYGRQNKVDTTVVRTVNVYGVGQSSNQLIPRLIRQIHGKPKALVLRSPVGKRDYIEVNDLVDSIVEIIRREGEPRGCLHVPGRPVRIADIVSILSSTCAQLGWCNLTVVNAPSKGDVASPEFGKFQFRQRAQSPIIFQPRISFEDGLKRVISMEIKKWSNSLVM